MPDPTPYERWQATVRQGVTDPAWSSYDADLRRMAAEINGHLGATPGYRILDWVFIKAMIWTESGAAHREWTRKPLQIGVTGDPGLAAVLGPDEGGPLIFPPAWRRGLTTQTARTDPQHNLHAGIAYLMMRLAYFDWRDVVPTGAPIREVTVRSGDNYDNIARRHGSTAAHVTSLNATPANRLRVGQAVRVQAAVRTQLITGWRTLDAQTAAERYNGGGDARYADKINYCLSLIRSRR